MFLKLPQPGSLPAGLVDHALLSAEDEKNGIAKFKTPPQLIGAGFQIAPVVRNLSFVDP